MNFFRWSAVYGTYKSQQNGNIADVRLKLIKGIETIRALGQHGLHVKLIVMLAKLFQERVHFFIFFLFVWLSFK